MKTHPQLTSAWVTAMLLLPAAASAATCSREDIDYYLKRGFTAEQVVKLCGNEPVSPGAATGAPVPAPVTAPAPVPPATTAAPPAPAAQPATDDLITLKSYIEADNVQLTPDAIVYTRKKDCLPYGEPNFDGFQSKACVITTTTLKRKGLRVLRVQEPVILLRDPEFVVTGDIRREMSGLEKHDRYLRQTLIDEYPERPRELNILFREDVDLQALKATFERLAL